MGDLIYRPAGGGARCDRLPLELTRNQVRAAGKRLVLYGDCGDGSRWNSWVHDDRQRLTASANAPFRDFPDCGPDYKRPEYDARQVRYYEDATQIGATTGSEHSRIAPALAGTDGPLRRGPGGLRPAGARRRAGGRTGVELGRR